MKEDILFQLFQSALDSALNSVQNSDLNDSRHPGDDLSSSPSHESLAKFVARIYLDHLNENGHVPFLMVQVVLADIEEEVIEMSRKKTYGHFNLRSYLSSSKTTDGKTKKKA